MSKTKKEILEQISTRLDKISENVKNYIELGACDSCNFSVLKGSIRCVSDDL